jgi:hypothetical protein
MAPKNAHADTATKEPPKAKLVAAPKAAPPDTPNKLGSAKALRNWACTVAPDAANNAPHNVAKA